MFKILSIDGGGIRGIIPARLLERLERYRRGLYREFDLYAGTSAGSILAAGFAAGLTPRFARQMFAGFGPEVFADSLWDDLRDLGILIGAEYSLRNLKTILERIFGGRRLGELDKQVLIASFDLKDERFDPPRWKPKFHHNFPGPGGDGDQILVDVLLRSSAAPVYFPSYQGYIDGGVAAVNPAMSALAQALHEGHTAVRLLSLGTGMNPRSLEGQDQDWGALQWGFNLVNLVIDGVSDVADFQCRQVLGGHYFRLQPLLPRRIDLDDWQSVPDLLAIADGVDLEPLVDWLREFIAF